MMDTSQERDDDGRFTDEDVELQREIRADDGAEFHCTACASPPLAVDREVAGIAVGDCPTCGRVKPFLPRRWDPRYGGEPPPGGPGQRARRERAKA